MSKSKLGIFLIIFGIASAIVGTFFYQNALTGIINQIVLGHTVVDLVFNLQYTSLLAICGIILIIIGVGLTFSKK